MMMKLEFDLGTPGLTLLHKAGLAGLYMTLQQLESEIPSGQRPGHLNWTLSKRGVCLQWQGNDYEVLDWLLQESFQLDDGLISLRGLDSKSMSRDAQVILHQGMLGTFLQHGKTRKVAGERTQALMIDEDKPPIVVSYKALDRYAHQGFARELCDRKGKWQKRPINIAGWLYPGATVRHNAFTGDTGFAEPPEMALLLLYAPVACYYYILRSRLRDQRAQYALVIPEIIDLEAYAQCRLNPHYRYATYKDFHASGLGDAGLRFLTQQATAETSQMLAVPRCQVLTLGTVSWSSQQKTRTDLLIVESNYQACKNYRICSNAFPPYLSVNAKSGESFMVTSFARELIAENLARNRPWYMGFADWVQSNEQFRQLNYERGGLYEMVVRSEMGEKERLFVQACHEAIRITYYRLYKKADDRNEYANIEREVTRIRTRLSRCKNSETFREFITDFWSRAGRIPTLQEHWDELMELVMDPQQWKKSRDLALLALASYKSRDDQPEQSDESTLISSPALEDVD